MVLSQTAELAIDRCAVDRHLQELFCSSSAAASGTVEQAMRYAVLGSAQRIRPILSLRVARVFDACPELTLRAATSVELLHCASLAVDDLPCMDNSPHRRDRESLHVHFGEATAVLAAFALVAQAARTVVELSCWPRYSDRLVKFQIALLRSLDCAGLIAGQAMDLELRLGVARTSYSSDYLAELKTAPLFNLAVGAGTLFADLDSNSAALMSGFGREFGLAFQLSDDLLDGEANDLEVSRKFQNKLRLLRASIAPFGTASRELEELIDYLHDRVIFHTAF